MDISHKILFIVIILCLLSFQWNICKFRRKSEDKYIYISVIEDIPYLLWQQELQIFNFKEIGIESRLVVVVLYDEQISQWAELLKRYHDRVFYFANRKNVIYKPSNKPYGIFRYLEKVNASHIFSIDQDVILKKPLPLEPFIQSKQLSVQGSQTAGYTSYQHITKDKGVSQMTIKELCDYIGLDFHLYRDLKNCIGAQYFFHHFPSRFFKEVAEFCEVIYLKLQPIATEKNDGQIAWISEMLAFTLMTLKWTDRISCPSVFNFSWGSDRNLRQWNKTLIFHNAGVSDEDPTQFDKRKYLITPPWFHLTEKNHFDYITSDTGPHLKYFDLVKRYHKYLHPVVGKVECFDNIRRPK